MSKSTYDSGVYHLTREADRMTTEAKRDAERLLRDIPPDTRGHTARLMGDPVFQRSALAQRRS